MQGCLGVVNVILQLGLGSQCQIELYLFLRQSVNFHTHAVVLARECTMLSLQCLKLKVRLISMLHGHLEISLLLLTDLLEYFEVSVDGLISLQTFLEKLLLTAQSLSYL